ncbi:hypothetical protein [Serratia ficaria]|uniref:hypothetical protein n=2 Tax=Serratia ficaria TaxID=61651 RepID=UPI00217ACE0C|nr:hypothetical protein [Serratia ficaria]CAI0761863.1 Uncharacterised protein [Serratia ficaria]CAI1567498.1 Uncharacterised protein [Serratia ficaria]CAI2404682.1 Uncharacterised protein [Serratia ficaria]CAI2430866.1 Uncharacterised protein [Serratia ficaria]
MMADESLPTTRITELPIAQTLNDTDLLPLSRLIGKEAFETQGGTLRALREMLSFKNAVLSADEGLSQTQSGQSFHVYTDLTRFFVREYANVDGLAEPTGNLYSTYALIDFLAQKANVLQTSPDSILDVVTANGVRPFIIREEDGATLFEMVAKLVTGNDGLKFGGTLFDNHAPDGWVWLFQSANGVVMAGVREDGTTVGLGGGGSGQAGGITPGDTAAGYDDIRNYIGEATARDVVGARIGGRFVVYPDLTDEDDNGGVLVGADGRRWVRLANHVSYDMFGAPRIPDDTYQRYVALSTAGEENAAQALLSNIEPADEAIARCHAFANKYGVPVVQNAGAFLWVGSEWVVRTSCNLSGSTVVTCNRSGTDETRWGKVDGVDDGAPEPVYMYRVRGKSRIDFTADELADLNANYSKYIKKGSTFLPMPKLYQHRGGMFAYISSAVELYRSGNRGNPRTQVKYRDFSRIGRAGALSDQLVKSTPAGTISEAWIQPKENAWLTFTPPAFFEAGNGRKFVNIQIERSQVTVNDLVLSNFASGNVESRVLLGAYGVTDIRLNNATTECMPNDAGGAYAICLRNSIEAHVTGYYGLYGWGFQGHHGVKRLFIDRSVMNRFDFHSFGYDVNISRTLFKGKQIYLQGGGKYTFEDNTFVVTQYSVEQASGTLEYRQNYMIAMREDYAGDCDCNLSVRDQVIRFDSNIDKAWAAGTLSFDVVRMNSGDAVNYGITTKTPHTIVGENIVFDLDGASSSLPDNFAFTFCRAYRSRYSTYNRTYLPSLISVKDMTAINVPDDKNAMMAVFRVGADLAGNPFGSRMKLRADGTNARIIGENVISVVNTPIVAANACPMVYLPGDTSGWDTAVDGTTYRQSAYSWVPKVTLINCDPVIINAPGARATFDIHGGLLARFTAGDTGNRCRVTGADIQLYPDAAGVTYFDADNIRTTNCDWLDPANGATYTGTLTGVGNENRGTPEHSSNI